MRRALTTLVVAGCAGSAAAQTLQFDINSLDVRTTNLQGAPSPFLGTNHTGSVIMTSGAYTSLGAVLIQEDPGVGFEVQENAGDIVNFQLQINMVGGVVTGGNLTMRSSLGISGQDDDVYTADISPGEGRVRATAIGGFTIDSVTRNIAFSDGLMGEVDVDRWFNFKGSLTGALLSFSFRPTPTGTGHADVDVFTVVPTPASSALMALGVLVAMRRRR